MFSEYAPAYWAAGLPVIPLRPRSKIPSPNAWQAYKDKIPDPDTQAQWLAAYPDGNIGLPLGGQSGMLALDLDSTDPTVLRILRQIMPPTPWERVGKKGAVYMFKFNGERTTRIKDEDGNTIVELLSSGCQVVLPPSIHPDTQMPYVANSDLLKVRKRLNFLPRDFEVTLRTALIDNGFKLTNRGSHKVTDWVPSGGRDSAMIAMAGLEARGVVQGTRSLLEAIHEVEVWIGSYTEKVAGDPLDPAKGRAKVMEFLRRDVVEGHKPLPKTWLAGMTDVEIKEARAFFGDDVEEWSLQQIFDYLTEKFTEVGPDCQLERGRIIDDILVRVSRSPGINDIQKDQLLTFIKSACENVTMGSLRKRVRDLDGGALQGKNHSEIAEALISEISSCGELRYDGGQYYQWRGSHWHELLEGDLLKIISKEFGHLDAARKFGDHKGILSVTQQQVRIKLGGAGVASGINFANGYLTTDGELLNHDPKFGCTYVLPYRYIPDSPSPQRFLGFLDQCWSHNPDYMDKLQALRQAMAATLFSMAPKFSRAILLVGVAHSGKSTLKNIMQGLVPSESVCTVPPDDWSDRFLPAMMNNKLVNFCGELSETNMIAGDRFKTIVEGEEISAQFKGRDIFKFRPMCAHWFASNHLPRTRDTSSGFNRRWLMLQFDRPLQVKDKILDLADQILDEENEAIVAWCVPAMVDLLRQADYTIPASHEEQISEVASQNNTVRFFMVSGLVVGTKDATMTEREIYNLYYSFCRLTAQALPSQLKKFRMVMSELQHELKFLIRREPVPGGEACFYDGLRAVKR